MARNQYSKDSLVSTDSTEILPNRDEDRNRTFLCIECNIDWPIAELHSAPTDSPFATTIYICPECGECIAEE